MEHTQNPSAVALDRLVAVVKELREKCPWDKVQTFDSLRRFTIEELYELVESIDKKNMQEVKEELGDVLTHIIFYSNIAEEEGHFTLRDVIDNNREKLIRRHPHIYGDGSVELHDDKSVERNWEKLKGNKAMFSGLPSSLPAITKAHKLQDKAERAGFSGKNEQEASAQLQEKIKRLSQATPSEKEAELGDLFFDLINYARQMNIDADVALERANRTFKHRIEWIEKDLAHQHRKIADASPEELALLWEKSKLVPIF